MNAFLSEWVTVMPVALISGALMTAGIALLLRFTTKDFPELRAWLWWLAGVKYLAGLFFAVPLVLPTPALPTAPVFAPLPEATAAPVAAMDTAIRRVSSPFSLVAALFTLWIIGIVVGAVYFVRQALALRRILKSAESLEDTPIGAAARRLSARMGLSRPPRVLVSDALTTPLTANPFRPCIVLPAALLETLSDAEIEMTLAHELAHIRRGDLLLAIPFTLAQMAFWFFPPVWFCARSWDAARESACDEMALRVTQSPPARYGELILKVVEADSRRLSLPALGVTSSFHTLKNRLRDLQTFSPSRTASAVPAALIFVIGVILAIPLRVTAGQGAGEDKGNLVTNAGFERGADSPDGWFYGSLFGVPQVQVARDPAVFHSGGASLRFVKTAATFAPVALLSQTLPPVEKGEKGAKSLRVRAYIKAQSVRKATLAVFFQNAKGENQKIAWGVYVGESENNGKPVTHDWKKYENVLPLPAGTRQVTLAIEMYGSGSVWLDDVFARYE